MPDRFIKDDPKTRFNRVLSRATTEPRTFAGITPNQSSVMDNYNAPVRPAQRWGIGLGDEQPSPTGGTVSSPLARRVDFSREGMQRRAETALPGVRFGEQPEQVAQTAPTLPALPSNMAPDMQAQEMSPFQQRFGRDTQGVYSPDTGRFAAPDDRRAQRTREFAARRGIPQISEGSPEARIQSQREAAAGRFRRGENLPGERVNAEGITYMPGSRMAGGDGLVRTGGSGGLYGNAAAEVLGAAQSLGQRRSFRRDQAASAAADTAAFERQYKTGMLGVSEMNALANYANSQRQAPGKNEGVVKVNMGAVDLQGNSLPDTLQVGNLTIPLDDTGKQALLSLRDEMVRTGRATTADQAWQLAGEAYALGLGTELQQE